MNLFSEPFENWVYYFQVVFQVDYQISSVKISNFVDDFVLFIFIDLISFSIAT